MGSITTIIQIGESHTYHGGIIPTHQLLLSENSRPAWSLQGLKPRIRKAVWIPTMDFLEDGLLMIGALVFKNAQLVAGLGGCLRDDNRPVVLHDVLETSARKHLHERMRQVGQEAKLVVTLLHGSSAMSQIGVLREYAFDVEVCLPVYRREYSAFREKVFEQGELPANANQSSPDARN